MGFLDKFEKGVENVTNRAMSRFSDDIEPIEIASKLRETMDKRAASFARDRSVVPNIFRIHLTPPSIERITAWGQDEMVRQMEEVAASLSEEDITEHLYTKGQPDPDLVIRTSGEQRLSGFLLWQSVHSEYYFCEVNWPAFRRVDFLRALRDFASRERRLGR